MQSISLPGRERIDVKCLQDIMLDINLLHQNLLIDNGENGNIIRDNDENYLIPIFNGENETTLAETISANRKNFSTLSSYFDEEIFNSLYNLENMDCGEKQLDKLLIKSFLLEVESQYLELKILYKKRLTAELSTSERDRLNAIKETLLSKINQNAFLQKALGSSQLLISQVYL